MRYHTIEVQPIAGSLGAEVRGADLSSALDDAVFAEIRRALVEHLVLLVPGQRLTPEAQIAFSARFGALMQVPYVAPLAEHPEIVAVLKEADEERISVFGGVWHSDFSFLAEPPALTLLYALETPPWGGDTLWANMYLAYESLSAGLRGVLDGLEAIHSGVPYGTQGPGADVGTSRSIRITRNAPGADREVTHPAVRTHPESRRKALFVNPTYTTRFRGMTPQESRPLLEYLYARATRPELTCRYRWRPGTLAIWDNRCTLHLAVNDYDGQRRLMHRTTVHGERPV